MIAGKDDSKMCELPLEETGLTRKRGAEVSGEFCTSFLFFLSQLIHDLKKMNLKRSGQQMEESPVHKKIKL